MLTNSSPKAMIVNLRLVKIHFGHNIKKKKYKFLIFRIFHRLIQKGLKTSDPLYRGGVTMN